MDHAKGRLNYAIDGVVVKVDDLYSSRADIRQRPPDGRWPSNSWPNKEYRTTGVTFQVGRLGNITPVAELVPVQLAGTTVKRASMHNFDS